MKEQGYQSKLIKYLESNGAYVAKIVSAGKKGVPDLLVCYKGQFIGIEVKTPTTRSNTSELQKYNLKKIKEAGGYGIVAVEIDDITSTLAIIEALDYMSCEDAPVLEKHCD
jgi:Holliday junction resolvase